MDQAHGCVLNALINLNQHGCDHVQQLVYYYIVISGQELSLVQ